MLFNVGAQGRQRVIQRNRTHRAVSFESFIYRETGANENGAFCIAQVSRSAQVVAGFQRSLRDLHLARVTRYQGVLDGNAQFQFIHGVRSIRGWRRK